MGLLLRPQGDRLHLSYDRGDAQTLRLTLRDYNGALLDVHLWSFKATVKASLDDAIASAIFQLSTPSNLGIDAASNGAQGIIDIKFSPALCGFPVGDFVYDVEGTDPSGNVQTVVPASSFFARKDVSTVGSPPSPPAILVPFPGDIQVIGGNVYIKDTGIGVNAGKFWKLVVQDGTFDVHGPSATVPF